MRIESRLACKGAKAFFNSTSGVEIIDLSYFSMTESANQMPMI
jgi:hypothetical protein